MPVRKKKTETPHYCCWWVLDMPKQTWIRPNQKPIPIVWIQFSESRNEANNSGSQSCCLNQASLHIYHRHRWWYFGEHVSSDNCGVCRIPIYAMKLNSINNWSFPYSSLYSFTLVSIKQWKVFSFVMSKLLFHPQITMVQRKNQRFETVPILDF